jgi:glutaminyl-peptide cyclotransferase
MKNSILLIAIAVFVFACGGDKKEESRTTQTGTETQASSQEVVAVKVPVFNADSAYEYIAQQLSFGPRVPNTKAHEDCGNYFLSFFKKYKIPVYTQKFYGDAYDGKKLILTNYVASYNVQAPKRIIIASHWDSRPMADQDDKNQNQAILGANDGASGVGIMLELIRIIQTEGLKPNVGIDFIFFDGEDYGAPESFKGKGAQDSWCLGSKYWSKTPHREGYTAFYGILLDMVGGKNAQFAKEGVSRIYAPTIVTKVWNEAQAIGYGNFFINVDSPELIDDHLYVNQEAKIPMIDIIQYEPSDENGYFAKYWHTHDDNLNAIDKSTLKAVGQTLLSVIYKETN